MRARSIAALIVAAGCGGGGEPAPDADPAWAAPQYADGANLVTVTEGRYAWSGEPWAGVYAWFSDSPDFLTETTRSGSCRLRVSDTMYCEGCEIGFCVGGVCTAYPEARSAGSITFTGLAVPLTLSWMDGYYSQSTMPPDDLFEPGDPITVTAQGDELPGFTLGATGVATIQPALTGACHNVLQIARGEDAEITWPDPVEGARVWLRLPSPTNGHGFPPQAQIECDGPDTGRFTVPAALIDALPPLEVTDPCEGIACEGHDCPPSTLGRYTRDTAAAGSETVQLRIGSEVNFYLFD